MKKTLVILLIIVICAIPAVILGTGCKAATQESAAITTAAAATGETSTAATTMAAETDTVVAATTYKFAIVPHFASHPFWKPAINGMKDAMAQFGVECAWIGPAEYDIQGQVDTIESSLKGGINGIAFSRPDPAAFNKVSQMALDLKIPVAVINTDSAEAMPHLPYVGSDGFLAGTVVAEQIIKYLPDGGKIAVCTPIPGHTDLEKRIAGFMEVMKSHPEFTIIGPTDITGEESKQIAAYDAIYLANPDMKGIISVGAEADVLARWMTKNNLKDKLVAGGFDVLPGAIEGLKTGNLEFTIIQNPYLQGFMPVAMFWWNVTRQVPVISINTGTSVVDSSNVEGFNPEFR